MNNTKAIHTAQIDRALAITAKAWESTDVGVDDMCDHMLAICDVVDGISTIGDFCEVINLTDRNTLN